MRVTVFPIFFKVHRNNLGFGKKAIEVVRHYQEYVIFSFENLTTLSILSKNKFR
jgi:hypothetical protein